MTSTASGPGLTSHGRLTVAELDPAAGDLGPWLDVKIAAAAADRPLVGPPSVHIELHWARAGEPGYRAVLLQAERDGQVVGHGWLDLPLRENLDTVLASVHEHPRSRGLGVADALLEAVVGVARETGRDRVVVTSHEPLDAPVGAADPLAGALTRAGASRALAELSSVLDLSGLPAAALAALHDSALSRAHGYAVEVYTDEVPAHLHDDLARLERSLSTDAPFDDLRWEEEDWDAERLAAILDRLAGAGARSLVAAARDLHGGRVVGWTHLVVADDVPDWAGQWSTVVAREHRGHRLGLLLKTANLSALRTHEPAVTRVVTENAGSNAYMLAVNRALGFAAVERSWEWELRAG